MTGKIINKIIDKISKKETLGEIQKILGVVFFLTVVLSIAVFRDITMANSSWPETVPKIVNTRGLRENIDGIVEINAVMEHTGISYRQRRMRTSRGFRRYTTHYLYAIVLEDAAVAFRSVRRNLNVDGPILVRVRESSADPIGAELLRRHRASSVVNTLRAAGVVEGASEPAARQSLNHNFSRDVVVHRVETPGERTFFGRLLILIGIVTGCMLLWVTKKKKHA